MRLFLLTILLCFELGASAQFWPKEFTSSQGKIVLYQPQRQIFDGNKVSGVMAFSLLTTAKKEPYFGALFFDAKLSVDRANTGYVIFENKSDRQFYLFGGEIWYTAPQIKGPWQLTKNVPKDVKKLLEQNKEAATSAGKVEQDGKEAPPAVVVATVPTELIQTKGEAAWKKYDSADIEYADNSEDNLFRMGSSFYVLKSGRWFTSTSLSNGWKFLPVDQLPAAFAKISSGSPKDIVLSSVPGTVEARDALLDAQVPQTATVDRKTAGKDVKVQYDGKPQFEKIEGTSLELVKNSDKTVFRAPVIPSGSQGGNAVHDNPKYYMVDNGIWYASPSSDGLWYVSDRFNQYKHHQMIC